ncbi:DUF1302 domain-containing protein [Pseudomonas veronii]|uniref:DUF1302 domain-containing protein n=1 Tax=Pseudomonas veronii TaxID=76761 RepID=UPI0015A3F665|nr:DUF1302 family protein [Pseudomonas veronii]NWC59612.1 DUF1302 family protein [Pseudomonas veronii]
MTCSLTALVLPSAQAGTFELGNDVVVDYLTTLNYALNTRVGKQSNALLSNINGDDGDRNFSHGSIFTNRISALGELNIHNEQYGAMLRGSTFYDFAYMSSNDNNSPDTLNKLGTTDHFTDSAQNREGTRTKLLDAYVYTDQVVGNGFADVRLGNQVVAWGESLYISGISGVQGPVDATKTNIPGTEIKEVLLPEMQLSGKYSINDLTLMGYTQFQNHPYDLPPGGDYFSYTDMVGPGSDYIRFAPGDLATLAQFGGALTRGKTESARDGGEWGVGAKYKVTPYTEVGIYRLRYSDRTPTVLTDFATLSYHLKYYEDIDLTGLSLSTRVGDWQFSGETTYKQGTPLVTNTGVSRGDVTQAQVSALKTWGNSWIAPQASFSGEFGAVHVNKVDDGGTSALAFDRNAQFGQFNVTLTYPSTFVGWDMSIPVTYGRSFNMSPVATFGFLGDGDARASIGTNFTYLNNLGIGVTYNAYLGSPNAVERPLADRDFIAFNIKYNL